MRIFVAGCVFAAVSLAGVKGTVRAIDIQPSVSPWPDQVFTPYVDQLLWPTPDIDQIRLETGASYFTLSFVLANASDTNDMQGCWGGYPVYPVTGSSSDPGSFNYSIINSINNVRAAGGDVMLSLGGVIGTPLAGRITDFNALADEYQRIVDAYDFKAIDLNIEGIWVSDAESIQRRSQAIKILQDNNPDLKVWITLPSGMDGLTPDGLNVVDSALSHGVSIDGVNVLAMNYDVPIIDPATGLAVTTPNVPPKENDDPNIGTDPDDKGMMGDYAIQAATGLHFQLDTLLTNHGISKTDEEIWKMVGVTPMIGVNNIQTEVFDLTEARELLAFSEEKGFGMLSFWSATRDFAPDSGQVGQVSPSHSGIPQADREFTTLYSLYANPMQVDLNGDGLVDDADLNLMLSDFDPDGGATHDQYDLEFLLANFGRTDLAAGKPVPEPSTAFLISMGIISLVVRMRRRQNQATS